MEVAANNHGVTLGSPGLFWNAGLKNTVITKIEEYWNAGLKNTEIGRIEEYDRIACGKQRTENHKKL